MNKQDNSKPSFYDLLLQAASPKAKNTVDQEAAKPEQKSFWHLLGFIIGFLVYCTMFYFGYKVVALKFGTPVLSYFECIEVALAIIALRNFMFRK